MYLNEAKFRIDDEGYCVLENQLEPREAERLDVLVPPFMDHNEGYINLEGVVLNYIPELAPLCIHPLLFELAERILGEGFVLPNICMKWCKPGAGARGLHADWPLGNMQKAWSESPTLIQIFWMLTDFTVENGATRVVPFSHHTRRAPTPNRTYSQEIPVVGKKGSLLIFHNNLWHRNGANTTHDQHRMAMNTGYIPWFIDRPKETWPLVKREIHDQLSPRLQELLVRSVER